MSPRSLFFYYDEGQSPREVDWLGQKNQIDAAKEAGVKHIVLVSSMAGTKPDHFLNTQMEGIVLWKRRAEHYLMQSGVGYTIVHPGGLMPHFGDKNPAPGGKRTLFVGVDDKLMDDEAKRLVPREDVAEVCLECILNPEAAKGRSFDLGSGPETETDVKVDLQALLAGLEGANCAYSQADAEYNGPEVPKSRDCGVPCVGSWSSEK